METEKALISVMVALESAHSFSAFMPSAFTIRTFALTDDGQSEQHISDLRAGYIPAIAYSLIIGWIASVLISSWWPLAGTLATAVFMVLVYEYQISGTLPLVGG